MIRRTAPPPITKIIGEVDLLSEPDDVDEDGEIGIDAVVAGLVTLVPGKVVGDIVVATGELPPNKA